LGVAARDAALLAVEDVNSRGGIAGRQLKLVVRDDAGDPETARQVDAELARLGVAAIIGHVTSSMTAAVIDQANEEQIVLLSPTSSSSDFTGIQDYFFRVMPDTTLLAKSEAAFIYKKYGNLNLTGLVDLRNSSFSQSYWLAFAQEYTRLGASQPALITYTSGEANLPNVMHEAARDKPQALLIIANAVDTALLVQYSRALNPNTVMFASTWAQTDELIEKGGNAVEGMQLCATYDPQATTTEYRSFVEKFRAHYSRNPSLGASHGYESLLALAEALRSTNGRGKDLAPALLKINNLQGVQGLISFNEYGDILRDIYITEIRNGQFVTIDVITPTP
jgi:branched-chain amino acid transport system substrate-binding protein